MRTTLLASVLFACGPGFTIDDQDAGPTMVVSPQLDGGPDAPIPIGPDGGIVLTQSVLAQVTSCEGVFERRDEYHDFLEDPTGVRLYGPAEIVDGSLRLPPDESSPVSTGFNLLFSLDDYRSLGTCTDLLLQAPGGDARRVGTAGKALGEGVSCGLDGLDGEIEMIEVSELGDVTLGRASVPWLREQLEVRIFTYNNGTASICEVMRLDTMEVVRLESNEATPVDAIHLEVFVYGDGDAAHTLVRETSAGIPQARFRELRQ